MIRAVGKPPPTSRTTVEVRGSGLLVPAVLFNSLASRTSRREVPNGSIKHPVVAIPTGRGSTLHTSQTQTSGPDGTPLWPIHSEPPENREQIRESRDSRLSQVSSRPRRFSGHWDWRPLHGWPTYRRCPHLDCWLLV